jgi:uncharacterized protein YuzE
MRVRGCGEAFADSMPDEFVRITYDPDADAAYVYLTDEKLLPGRDSVPVDPPEGLQAIVVIDWKDGKLVGLEVLGAASLLHADLLAQAARPGQA